jgi:hypothetical protein
MNVNLTSNHQAMRCPGNFERAIGFCEELRKQARESSLCIVILNQTKCLLASTGDFG